MAARKDAIVIGGGVSGLVAAAYLSRAGLDTVLLEARPFLGGLCAPRALLRPSALQAGLAYAIDPVMVRELRLAKRGFGFLARDVPLVGLRRGGKHIVFGRTSEATAAFIRQHSKRDADTYGKFRRSLLSQARIARGLWWDGPEDEAGLVPPRALSSLGAGAMLDMWFESDAVKATLAFDATADGVSLDEPPSALTLLWRAAQANNGLQGATGIPHGGMPGLVAALYEAVLAARTEVRISTRVARLMLSEGAIAAAILESGEEISAPLVLSGLSRRATYALLPAGEAGLGDSLRYIPSAVAAAQLWFVLDSAPDLKLGRTRPLRFVVADRLEHYSAAHEASRNGLLPADIPFEATGIPVKNGYELSVLARPLPRNVQGGWDEAKVMLAAKVIAALGTIDPGIVARIKQLRIATPADIARRDGVPEAPSVERLLSRTDVRVSTAVPGLYACGADAEPVSAVSGRAARMAAALAIRRHRYGRTGSQP
ncbi:MAG: NAD(P)/FAD-dependent oxidoreductase [Alphaproteobacteria bacterium]|nr:NAD(P)/FAD-dependent oxidoreductase [Alphaproteobacteria bacterium]